MSFGLIVLGFRSVGLSTFVCFLVYCVARFWVFDFFVFVFFFIFGLALLKGSDNKLNQD